jgi:hypothetical protein
VTEENKNITCELKFSSRHNIHALLHLITATTEKKTLSDAELFLQPHLILRRELGNSGGHGNDV